jgi:hypothetical protein
MSARLVSPACARPSPPAVAQRLDGIALRSPPLSGYLGYKFGYVAVFVLAAAFGVIAIACVLMIPAKAIDDRASRGCNEDDPDSAPDAFTMLLKHRTLLVLALALFHLGNAGLRHQVAVTARHCEWLITQSGAFAVAEHRPDDTTCRKSPTNLPFPIDDPASTLIRWRPEWPGL